MADGAYKADEVQRQLIEQKKEIELLRRMIVEQSRLLRELRARIEQAEQTAATPRSAATLLTASASQPAAPTSEATSTGVRTTASDPSGAIQTRQAETGDARLGRVEAEAKRATETITRQLGNITFSGDIRLQYDSIYGQLSTGANSTNPAVLGNELTARHRARLRARLAIRGTVGKEFAWGLRLSTNNFTNVVSSNQVLTDFYGRKPFGLDQAYLQYTPERLPGLRLQGGKFEIPWLRTEMTFDNDLQVEGINELYSRDFKNSRLKNLTLIAWQLPFLERNAAFVLGSDGRVDVDASRRAGRDLALYGGQARARFDPTSKSSLTLSATNLYFSGTQFITPIQFLGPQLQLPVTMTIPATATEPSRTLSGVATVPRDFLVAGNSNLGLSNRTNNALNRDGRLASGFNLVDLIARLDITARSSRFPVGLIFNFVTNTQARDVIVAGPGGANRFLENNEGQGYWAEVQVGRTRERGDFFAGYTFFRVEKDAVLTPFNFDDTAQQSDIRAQRFTVSYTVDPRVVLSFTGLVTERCHGLLGVFGQTPPGSLNRPTVRLQFDTTFRF